MENPFAVLGIPESASKEEIKAAYHRLCLQFHPDKCPPNEKQNARRVFSRITEAYSTLRKNYGSSDELRATSFRMSRKPRISNVAVASILGLPVILSLLFVGMQYEQIKRQTGRHGGLLHPPMNPFLRPRRHKLSGQSFSKPAP